MSPVTPHPLVLLPSPLLGPAVWGPVAARMRSRGYDVVLPGLPPTVSTAADVLAGWLADIPVEPEPVLVPHSNAGLYVAALADARRVRGIVFVDAGLPSREPVTPLAPPGFRAMLGGLADDAGMLPPWTRWWPPEETAQLFPDPETRTAVEREQRRLPLSYFDGAVPSPAGWQGVPVAYLAFGDTYADERAFAERSGWPVETLPGEHLHMLVEPVTVADALTRLAPR